MSSEGWYAGHRKGYLDAVTEIWEMAHEASAGGADKQAIELNRIAEDIRRRYNKVEQMQRAADLASAADL